MREASSHTAESKSEPESGVQATQVQSLSDKSGISDIPLHRCPDLVIKTNTPKGRGVFATKPIPAKTIIDVCPVLVLDLEENKKHIENTSLYHYTYNWPTPHPSASASASASPNSTRTKTTQAIIFGLGSMFNHSTREQNVVWERDIQRGVVTYRALRDISAGEELCISYGAHLTFEDADAAAMAAEEQEDDAEMLGRIQLY